LRAISASTTAAALAIASSAINSVVRALRARAGARATGVAIGHAGRDVPYAHILTSFVPALRAAGLDEAVIRRILIDNPGELLAVRS
jgi:predicted metal-dependent phosphotriesterase family hydrolase